MSREGPSKSSDNQNASQKSQDGGNGLSKDGFVMRSPVLKLAVFTAGLSDGAVNGLCGAMAGMASGIVTCPLDVIKTKLQAQGSFRRTMNARVPTAHLYNGLMGTAKTIWLEDGIRGMYRGLGPMLLGYLPTWAVYMTVYDSSKNYYYSHVGRLVRVCCYVSLTYSGNRE
jgi:solute carrier family 25 (mitochondrial folate transporter), member 32